MVNESMVFQVHMAKKHQRESLLRLSRSQFGVLSTASLWVLNKTHIRNQGALICRAQWGPVQKSDAPLWKDYVRETDICPHTHNFMGMPENTAIKTIRIQCNVLKAKINARLNEK